MGYDTIRRYGGHDSKYPAWHEVNRALKRPQDDDAMTSLRWLLKEAKEKYRTYLSFHINIDLDGDGWDEQGEVDIVDGQVELVLRNRDGRVLQPAK